MLGQPEAVDCLVERVAMIKAGLTDPTRPQGVFLFVGPTGTGKTEIAKTLAEFLFGSPDRMVRLDMSEFQTPESLERLLGDAARDERGAPSSTVRKQPFSVVLLDEFEKAHPNVWDVFLQVFDDGRLTDRRGNTADFRHCVIIMTSNLGATLPTARAARLRARAGAFAAGDGRARGRPRLPPGVPQPHRPRRRLPPARARRDARPLRKELNDVLTRRGLRTRRGRSSGTSRPSSSCSRRALRADLGARPLKRAVERYLLSPLAMTIVNHQFPEGDQFLFVRPRRTRARRDVRRPGRSRSRARAEPRP